MVETEKLVAELDEKIRRRKSALEKAEKGGERPGVVGVRRLRKLVKQVERRKAKLVKDQGRRSAGKKGADAGQ